jgi:hypothetical protein
VFGYMDRGEFCGWDLGLDEHVFIFHARSVRMLQNIESCNALIAMRDCLSEVAA